MPVLIFLALVLLHIYVCVRYLRFVTRIFQEKPLFVIPRGQPLDGAEEVRFPTRDGLTLCGCYLQAVPPRRGVILFGLEFGSNRWACRSYCDHLVEKGFDVFAFESRNQGDSDAMPRYEPLQWVTTNEVCDTEAALTYLKSRPDADPNGIGFFGISKGGSAGLIVAAQDPYIRCCVTDGSFATFTTLVPYMKHWFRIYNNHYTIQGLIPLWFYGLIGLTGIWRTQRVRRCRFPHLERYLPCIAPRPLLMIHGMADTYIKPDMTTRLFEFAREPKELWLVENAKHNQALQVAGEDYRQRVLRFFETHLAQKTTTTNNTNKEKSVRSRKKQYGKPTRRFLAPLFRVFTLFL
jgi:pimeloyl-ACP methyl ester carboxylesterase